MLFLVATLFALVGAGLLLASTLEPTWTFTAQEPSGPSPVDQTLAFYPGSTFSQTCERYCPSPGSSITVPYSAWGLHGTGALYGAYQVLFLALGALAVLLALVVGLAARSSRRQQYHHRKLLWEMRLAGMVPLLALGLLVLAQPAAIASDGAGVTSVHWAGVSPSPSQSFAGSCSATSTGPDGSCPSGEAQSWGPGLGFYLALVGGFLVLGGSTFLTRARRALLGAPRAPEGAVSLTGGTPGSRVPGPAAPDPGVLRPPPAGLARPFVQGLPPVTCARCGAFTPGPAVFCRICGERLSPP